MSDVSFVVLNYNDAPTTIALVDSLLQWHCTSFGMHVVVVDNCSTDDSVQLLQKYFDGAKPVACTLDFVRAQRNGGYSYGNNYGASFALDSYGSDYIAIANPDIAVDEGTVTELLQTFEADRRIALCAPVVVDSNGSCTVRPSRIPTYVDDLRACRLRNPPKHIDENEWQVIAGHPDYIVTALVLGAFFVVRSDVFVRVGMLDEGVFLFCEERILGKRLLDAGCVEVLRGDLRYEHKHGSSINSNLAALRTERILLQSRAYYQRTYGGCGPVRRALFRIWGEFYLFQLRVLFSLRKRNWG